MHKRAFILPIILQSLVDVIADQITKYIAITQYGDKPLVIIPELFQLSPSINTGIAFGIPIPNGFMIILSPIIIVLICRIVIAEFGLKDKLTPFICALFVAGGLGNLIDRVIYGGVVDFIAFSFWPSFNLADSYLTIAAFLLIVKYARSSKGLAAAHKP